MNDTNRIIVVDDTPANLTLLDGMLREWGYRVRAFPLARLALSAAMREPPDLVLLDITMPEIDGYEACRQLKAEPALASVPVIFISALSEPLDKVKAFHCGGVDYITKPFQVDEVRARVETHLQIRRLQRSLETKNHELQENIDRLRELEGLRDNLTHMIVHDMRSPLTAIAGNLELLSFEASSLSASGQECLQDASTASSTLIEMVSSLLDVSRLESGQMPLQMSSCDLLAVIDDVSHLLSGLLKEHRLVVETTTRDPWLTCDPGLIARVIGNLVSNAVKFAPATTEITVGLDDLDDGLRLSVRDRGRGIPAADHARIFEKFGQVREKAGEPRRMRWSTGLGLTFCKLAVEAHGGRIGVDSAPGEGSTFWFVLPRRS